jgi:hypothetical protein
MGPSDHDGRAHRTHARVVPAPSAHLVHISQHRRHEIGRGPLIRRRNEARPPTRGHLSPMQVATAERQCWVAVGARGPGRRMKSRGMSDVGRRRRARGAFVAERGKKVSQHFSSLRAFSLVCDRRAPPTPPPPPPPRGAGGGNPPPPPPPPKPLPRRMLARPLLVARAMTTMSSPPHPLMIVAGTFDLLHAGHHILFHTAFAFGEKVEIWVSVGRRRRASQPGRVCESGEGGRADDFNPV